MPVVVVVLSLLVCLPGVAHAQSANAATIIQPANGATNVEQTRPITWTRAGDTATYYLYIGTSPGAKDLVDSGELKQTSFTIPFSDLPLPVGPTLYATLWTEVAGSWDHRDSTFTAAVLAPAFIYPRDGAIGVDGSRPIQWTAPPGSTVHALQIGTTPGGTDVYAGELTGPSVRIPGLPRFGTLYARALAQAGGSWRYTDIAFTAELTPASSTIVSPAHGAQDFDTVNPFEWVEVPIARGYRLTIGSSEGATNLHDSGLIHTTRRFVPKLPIGPAYGRIYTRIGERWEFTDFRFDVVANSASTRIQIENAAWAAHVIRGMAAIDNHPLSWTLLAARGFLVNCAEYVDAFLQLWNEMNGQLVARRLDVAMNPNSYDAHTLTELWDADAGRWVLIDPTFDVSMLRSDGSRATAEDVSMATRSGRWSDVTYLFGRNSAYFTQQYPIDYPLLFLNVYHEGDTPTPGSGPSVLPYTRAVAMPWTGAVQRFVIGCSGERTAVLEIDKAVQTIDCSGVDGLSRVFEATSIAPTSKTTGAVRLYQLQRYVF